MKKALKILLIIFSVAFIAVSGFCIYVFAVSKGAELDPDKLVNMEKTLVFYDINGQVISEESERNSVVKSENIKDYTKNAFIAIEDKRFYSHNGVDKKGLLRAAFNNLRSFSFKEGASTISQQLIKNTHLSNEKTFKRKIVEIKLAKELEKKYTKEEILEMYLNTIYFGNGSFGISEAAKNYFSKNVEDLDINESAALAGIIKAPSNYSPLINYEKCLERKNLVLKEMKKEGYITQEEYEENLKKPLEIFASSKKYDFMTLAKKEADVFFENGLKYNSKYEVYTFFDPEVQKLAEAAVEKSDLPYDKAVAITDFKSRIKAFYSTCTETNRQLGSTIKPLLVYAPAIENNVVNSCTPVLDEKTDFNGYRPSNYNDKYYGYVSVKESLAKSLNTCAVKLLSATGIETCKKYASAAGIEFTENDNSLNIALGSTEKGAKITDLVAAYGVFSNGGNYNEPSCISKITDKNGKTVYSHKEKDQKVFSEETAYIMNEMLKYTVKNGTAAKLCNEKYSLCAKTGTVGNENGNTDAYTVSYSPQYTVGVWVGNDDSSYMPNSVTGGTVPAKISYDIWEKLYKLSCEESFSVPEGIVYADIDKISYEKENKVVLAESIAPKRYVLTEIFKKDNLPKETSDRFSSPMLSEQEISVNNKGILIKLCLTELFEAKIYRENRGKKILLYDTKNGKKEFLDTAVKNGEKYLYSVVPYFGENSETAGKEYYFNEIKFSEYNGDWWTEEWL